MDLKLIETRANLQQTNIDAETEIRELPLNELDHVAGGVAFLTYTFRQVFITSI